MRLESHMTATEILCQSTRGWKNLNEIARICIENRATNEGNAISISKVARLAGADTAQFSRLLNDKAGFVRTYKRSHGKQAVGTGVYYLADPLFAVARAENAEHWYPKNLAPVAERVAGSGLLKSVMLINEQKPDAPKHDSLIAQLVVQAGVKTTDEIVIPVVTDVAAMNHTYASLKDDTIALFSKFENMATPLGQAPDSDLDEIEIQFARLAWKSAVNYWTVKQIKEGRLLK